MKTVELGRDGKGKHWGGGKVGGFFSKIVILIAFYLNKKRASLISNRWSGRESLHKVGQRCILGE